MFNLVKISQQIIVGLVFSFVFIFLLPTEVWAGTSSTSLEVQVEVTCPGDICAFQGCTDQRATNFDPEAGYDNGSCTYPPDTSEVYGCTDPEATNYNSNATADDGSCRYRVPNVLNFNATKSGSGVRLSWSNPSFPRFSSVIIVKSPSQIPSDLNDGEIIYNGSGHSVVDNSIVAGTTYYYLAIVQSTDGDYSSGSLTEYLLEPEIEPPIEPPIGPTLPGGGGSSGGGSSGPVLPVSPFEQLPIAVNPPIITGGNIAELFVFTQAGEKSKPFFDGGYIKIKGNKPFTISVDYYKLPEVLKTIGVTMYNVNNPNQSFSFLMKLNADRTAYEATVGALPEDGVYAVSIYLINYQDQTIQKYSGQVAVVGTLGLLGVGAEKFVKQVAGPIAVTGGVAAGTFQLLFASGRISSFSDIYLFLFRQIGAILGLLGLKKKNKPWGTVYDAITKRPIDPAYVTVLAGTEEIATAITDIDGRYGFSLLDGNYSLKANKTHYQFPSTHLSGRSFDEMYDNLYFGEVFHAGAGEIISKNIPLDPIGFDWNEFVKGSGDYFKLHTGREFLRAKIMRWFYKIGFLMSVFYLIFYPSVVNILVPIFYFVINLVQRYWIKQHRVVTIKKSLTGEPLSFAIVRVFYVDLEQEVKKIVADMVGRFYLLVRPGTYYLTIDQKQTDGSYVRVYQSPPTELKNGIWNKDILV